MQDENFTVDGIAKELVGTIVRKDGSRQLTIAGMPQYRFAKDGKPGETKGQGLQGKWFATGKDGERTNLAARTGVITGLGAVLTNDARPDALPFRQRHRPAVQCPNATVTALPCGRRSTSRARHRG